MSDLIDRAALRDILRATGASGAQALLTLLARAPIISCAACEHEGGCHIAADAADRHNFGCSRFQRRRP